MKQTNAIRLGIIIVLILIVGGVFFFLRHDKTPDQVLQEDDSTSDSMDMSEAFVVNIQKALPYDHPVSASTYQPTPQYDKQTPSFFAIPCAKLPPIGDVPIVCRVRFEFWTDTYSNIDSYLADELYFDTYEQQFSEALSRENSNGVTRVVMPSFIPCFGTGGDSCVQKQYAFFFPNGTVGRAVISHWPYNKHGNRIDEPSSLVSEVIAFYEGILHDATTK